MEVPALRNEDAKRGASYSSFIFANYIVYISHDEHLAGSGIPYIQQNTVPYGDLRMQVGMRLQHFVAVSTTQHSISAW